MNLVKNKTFDEERALYGIRDANVENCIFAGPADGESVLKEARNITVQKCDFSLRYPLWHVNKFQLVNSSMDELTRAPIWYSHNGKIDNCTIHGIKAVRECSDIEVYKSNIVSPEFGWKSHNIRLINSEIESEYIFMDSTGVALEDVKMSGKYSFQYMKNLRIINSVLDTKDAFWHSENIMVENCVVKGEYLAWFSKNLTMINCKIIGTQPFCYCEGLKLINCEMEDTDLAFEYSDVAADIKGHIISVKNPKSGRICADSVGEVIYEDAVMECVGEVVIRG